MPAPRSTDDIRDICFELGSRLADGSVAGTQVMELLRAAEPEEARLLMCRSPTPRGLEVCLLRGLRGLSFVPWLLFRSRPGFQFFHHLLDGRSARRCDRARRRLN